MRNLVLGAAMALLPVAAFAGPPAPVAASPSAMTASPSSPPSSPLPAAWAEAAAAWQAKAADAQRDDQRLVNAFRGIQDAEAADAQARAAALAAQPNRVPPGGLVTPKPGVRAPHSFTKPLGRGPGGEVKRGGG